MNKCIIGIDCATDRKKVGISLGYVIGNELIIDQVLKPTGNESVSDVVSNWIAEDMPTLLAIDAPLGWPESLGKNLIAHIAGNTISCESNDMFRRETDRFIKREIGKQPLDVGADRIARTAHSALKYLGEIGQTAGKAVPLAWDNDALPSLAAIEVYPAATLKQCGFRSDGYKKKENVQQRLEIIASLSAHMEFRLDITGMSLDDDLLDAAVCQLAAYHFLKGECFEPDNPEQAKKEGWIWVVNDQGRMGSING